ncbi:MAG: hypothetical protein A2Z37_16825 [Chloroflexi bacterium RBG_19FT_COMBO_62_14]|nr:MAG: hypothetical protein A2Z37_16825 [Chloroflexi bacterium RBG_19FT_COMBO_62_14]
MLAKPLERPGLRQGPPVALGYRAETHEWLRFRVLTGIAVLKLLNLFGGIWDIQWHLAIGRDSLWIPPHLLVIVAFVSGVCLVTWMIAYETHLTRSGEHLADTIRLGPIYAPLGFFGVFVGYAAALLSGGFDELWHRMFGIDVTLWSPPHLAIMFSTMIVDYSLLIGLSVSARRMGLKLRWDSPFFWAFVLVGAYTFEAVNFQMAQAFIVSYTTQTGLVALLFPLMVGSLFPMSLLLILGLGRRFWLAALIFVSALGLQYVGVGLAAVGFAALKPISVVEEFVRLNPDSTIALARQFASRIGFNGLIGFEQAWTMMLSAVPLGLVSLLQLWAWARRHPLIAAPVYSVSLVVASAVWFHRIPMLSGYRIAWYDIALGAAIAASLGLLYGRIGLGLARLGAKPSNQTPGQA